MSKVSEHLIGLKARWVLQRNRVLGSGRFQSWAARWPIFRSVARKRAAHQFNLIAGFVYTKVIETFVETGLIGSLNGKLRSIDDLMDELQMGEEATLRLLKAGAAIKLTESPQDGLWTLGQVGAELSANVGAMAMIRHHALLYRDLDDTQRLLSEGRNASTELARFWTYAAPASGSSKNAQPYSELMAVTQPMIWQQVLGRYGFSRHRRMLDIGGGSGGFAEAVGYATPSLELGIFDLPDVVPLAADRFSGSTMTGRVRLHPGSFREDPLPGGYDLITLIRILHDHEDEVVQDLLEKTCAALPDGGRLLIVEPMAETRGAEPMGDAYFGLYLWAMGSGRPRTFAENAAMARRAGFRRVNELRTNLPIIARACVAER